MKSWTDEHFVKVQDPPVSGYNKIVFKNGKEERPSGFLSYSACGTVSVRSLLPSHPPVLIRIDFRPDDSPIFLPQGPVLYGHYGTESDFMLLRSNNVDLSGTVMLVRAGENSFAEKVRGGSSP